MAVPQTGRELRLAAATALVVGQVIAVGIFLTPGTIIRTLASPFAVLLLWTVMGGMAVCGALCYGALAARYPQAGGGYVYLREVYGPRVAFLYEWKCLLVMDPGITAALATGFAAYLAYLWPMGDVSLRLSAIGAIVVFAGLHVAGLRIGVRVLSTITALKIALVVGLTVAAWASPVASFAHFQPFVGRAAGAPPLLPAVAGAFVAAFFSFGGWWEVTRIAGEVRDPARTLPRALVLGLLLVTATYAAATMAFLAVVPPAEVAAGQAIVGQVGEAVLGAGGRRIVALVVIVCVLGSLGAMQMLAPRLYVAMARDGVFPASAAVLHPRWGTPARAIVLQASLASVLVALGTFDGIIAYFVFITVVFIAVTVASVFVLRRRDATFVVPGYPWTPSAFLALVAVLLVLLAVNAPRQALSGVLVVSAALPVYHYRRRRRDAAPFLEESLP